VQGGNKRPGKSQGDDGMEYAAHWKDLQGAKYFHLIHPKMLTDNGHIKALDCRLIGEPKGRAHSRLRNVLFDRQYVIEKLAREMGPLFDACEYKEIQRLISEARKQAQKREV
jgi:hypothetical protein